MENRRSGATIRGHINRIRHGKCRTLLIMTALLSAWIVIHFTRSNLEHDIEKDVVEENISADRKYPEIEAKRLQKPQTEEESTTEVYKQEKGTRKGMKKVTKRRKQPKTEDASTTAVQQPKTEDKSTTVVYKQDKKEKKRTKQQNRKAIPDSQSNLMKNLKQSKQEKDEMISTTDTATDDYKEYEKREKEQKNIKKITNVKTTTEFSPTDWDMKKAVNTTPASLTEQQSTNAPTKLKFDKSAKKHPSADTAALSDGGKSDKQSVNKLEMELPVENKKTNTDIIQKPINKNIVAMGPGEQTDDDEEDEIDDEIEFVHKDEKPKVPDINEIRKQSAEQRDPLHRNTDQTVKNRSLLEYVEKTNINIPGKLKETQNGDEHEKAVIAVDPMEHEQAILNRMKSIKEQEKSIQAKWSKISNDMDKQLNQAIQGSQ